MERPVRADADFFRGLEGLIKGLERQKGGRFLQVTVGWGGLDGLEGRDLPRRLQIVSV